VCFEVDKEGSLYRVEHIVGTDIRTNEPTVPVILVGTKKDLRHEADETKRAKLIPMDRVIEVKEAIGAVFYHEVSSFRLL
jgi:GTPase SAR1 family protein